MEKKELEDKLNSELERKMEEHLTTASNRENLLQDEIRSWQVKLVVWRFFASFPNMQKQHIWEKEGQQTI